MTITHLVLYHSDCRDGMCAAMVCWLNFKDAAIYRPVNYGGSSLRKIVDEALEAHPTLQEVFVVDFTFRGETDTIIWMLRELHLGVTLIDHHKTAIPDIEEVAAQVNGTGERVSVRFSEDFSGAALTWLYLFPQTALPPVVAYTQDRDIWQHKLPDTEAVNAYLQSTPLEMKRWVSLFYGWDQRGIVAIGTHQLTFMAGQIGSHANRARYVDVADSHGVTYRAAIFGYSLKEVASETCHFLLTSGTMPIDLAIGIPSNLREDGYTYSVRSKGNDFAREFAESYGGGGHDQAAGFKLDVPLEWTDVPSTPAT